MMGSFLTRGLMMVFGYAYPAYECFKTVERNKPDIEQLRFWCQYWILVAVLTVSERVGDTFISWLPMYSEAKLAFFIYLWYPKTKGTTYVYNSFVRPFIAKHETEIDRNLLELRTRAGDVAVRYWQKAASYGQTRIFEILHYVASQSTSKPRAAQQQQKGVGARQPSVAEPTYQPANTTTTTTTTTTTSVQQRAQQSPSRTSSMRQQHEATQEAVSPPAPPAAVLRAQTVAASHPTSEARSQLTAGEAEAMQQIEPALPLPSGSENPTPQETVMEAAIRVTRGRLQKTRAAARR